MKTEVSFSALRWPRVETIETLQERSVPRWRTDAGFEMETEEKNVRELALLTILMVRSLRRVRALWSWQYGTCSERERKEEHALEKAGRREE